MERVLNQLVERLGKKLGERLIAVVLYGSAAADDYHGRFSDLNILCVLDRVTSAELAQAESVFHWWRGLGNAAPLLLSREELITSTDCFPIEFHDIRNRYRILSGEDVIASLELDDSFYRAEVEHDLRAKLLRLRQKASGVLSDKELLRRLLFDSVSTFCVLFRHALVLAGEAPVYRKREVIERAAARFGISSAPFSKILDVRERRAKPGDLDPGPVFAEYLAEIGKVIDVVDAIDR